MKTAASTNTPIVYTQPTEEQRDRMMDFVIDAFDFEKVHKVMVDLDWKWVTETGDLVIPDIYRLRSVARRLLRESYRCQQKFGYSRGMTAAGGFQACFYPADIEGDANFHLLFVVTEEQSYDYYQPNYPEQ